MPQLAPDSSTKTEVTPGQAPQSADAPLNSSIDAPKGNELDDLRRSMREFKDETVTVAQDRLRGAQSNARSTEKDYNESGALGWISGSSAAMKKQLDADIKMVDQRRQKAEELEAVLKQTEVLVKEYGEKLEVIKQRDKEFLEKQERLEKELKDLKTTDAEYTRKLEEKFRLEDEHKITLDVLRAEAQLIKESAYKAMAIDARVDTSAYSAAMREVNANLDGAIKTLDRIETGAKVVHTGCVVVAATAITIGTAGAGAGIGGAMIAGTVGGTAIGALGNGVEAAGHVAYGNKTTSEALSDAGSQTLADAQSALQASASAAVGGGLANSSAVTGVVGKGVTQYVVAPALVQAGNTAISTTSEVMAARSEYAKFLQSPEFIATYGAPPEQLLQTQRDEIQDKFFQDRGLDWGSIAKNGAIDVGVAVAGSAIGAKVNAGGAKTILGTTVRTGIEGAADIGVGIAAAKLKGQEVTIDTVGEQVQNAVVGRVVSASVGSVQSGKALKPDGTPKSNLEFTPSEGSGSLRSRINATGDRILDGYVSRFSTAKYEEAAVANAKALGVSAKDFAGEKVQQAAGAVKGTVQDGFSAAAARGREMINRARGIETPAPEAPTVAAAAQPAKTKPAAANPPAKEQQIPGRPQWLKVSEGGAPDLDALKTAAAAHQAAGKGTFRLAVSNADDLAAAKALKKAMPDCDIEIKGTKEFIAQIKAAKSEVQSGNPSEENKSLAAIKLAEPERVVAKTPQDAGAALADARKALENGAHRVELKIEDPEAFRQNVAELRKLATHPDFKGRLQIRGTQEVVDFINESKAIVAIPENALTYHPHQESWLEAARWKAKPVQSEPAVHKLSRPDESQVAAAATAKPRDDSRKVDLGGNAVPTAA